MKTIECFRIGAAIVVITVTTACTAMYDPIPFSPAHYDRSAFAPSEVTQVTLVPVADVRADKTEQIHPNTIVTLERHFRGMGYEPLVAPDYGSVQSVTADDLEEPRKDWIRRIGPEGAEWVFLFAVEDLVSRDKTFGSAYGTECSGFLYQRSVGELAWQHSAAAQEGVGGVAGTMPGFTRSFSQGACIGEVLSQFPVRGDKRWMRYKQFIELRRPNQ